MKRANNKEYLEIIEEIAGKCKELKKLKTRPKEFNKMALSILRDIQRLIDTLVLVKDKNHV